jgi:hypothetical protein
LSTKTCMIHWWLIYTIDQDCQTVHFQTKNSNLDTFWRALGLKMFIYFIAVWNILQTFEIFYDDLVHFVRVARFFLTQYTKRGKIYQITTTYTIVHKIYQMTLKYSKWTQTIRTLSILRLSKIYRNLYFWFENIPSGNPAFCAHLVHFSQFWYHVPRKNLATLQSMKTGKILNCRSVFRKKRIHFLMFEWPRLQAPLRPTWCCSPCSPSSTSSGQLFSATGMRWVTCH